MGVVSRRCVCLVGVFVRRYIDFVILLIPTPLVYALAATSLLFVYIAEPGKVIIMIVLVVILIHVCCNCI